MLCGPEVSFLLGFHSFHRRLGQGRITTGSAPSREPERAILTSQTVISVNFVLMMGPSPQTTRL